MKPTSKAESNYKTFLDELEYFKGGQSKGKRWLKRRISKARRVVDKIIERRLYENRKL